MTVGRVHLLYGLAGSGKSTLARELSSGGRAVRFTLDEWMLRLHPDLDFESAEYGHRSNEVRELVWTIAEQVLMAGVDVVLDWNSWSAARRRWAVERASMIGASVTLHKMTASVDQASAQVRERAIRGAPFAHQVTSAGNEHLATLMQEPSSNEQIEICTH
jgi:hypothetical protein